MSMNYNDVNEGGGVSKVQRYRKGLYRITVSRIKRVIVDSQL